MARFLFLSGPMSGKPDDNFPLFDRVARLVGELGSVAVNPAQIIRDDLDDNRKLSRHVYMRHLVPKMVGCQGIVLLPDWTASWGSRCEIAVAIAFGYDLWYRYDQTLNAVVPMHPQEDVLVSRPLTRPYV